jgi:hypothetical protein
MSGTSGRPGDRRGRKTKTASVGQTIGGVLVGFDEQVLGRRPPGQEIVVQVDRLHSVSPAAGLTVDHPDDVRGHDDPDAPRTGGR